ncbi:MAG: HDIG domain-containing protein [Candidatus Omnitrophica bacterium]|nr:HDIG domain-containing protein [Candidatus Omnitrophota bacterium]
MTKQSVINKVKFALGAMLLFLISFILHINFAVSLFLLSLAAYLKFNYPGLNQKNYNLLNLTFLFVITLAISLSMFRHGWPVFMIPFCMVPMLAAVLFEERFIVILLSLACAVTIASVVSAVSFYVLILFLISGILSAILLVRVRRRSHIIRAGWIIGAFQAITLLFFEHFKINNAAVYLTLFLNGIASSIIVVGILPVFEYLFNTATNISLLELADFDNPILRQMMMEAPGTYHHSLIVGNLSEAAAQAIGAHALLARIGAYYHDIGKLSKPEYFSENQEIRSKHDTLSPSMSKMIIMNHVKEGMELAKKQRLKPPLIDFIQQHHGTSLVYYFYRKALERQDNGGKIQEEGFRYPGPKPKTKESAIVLLADSVEAATRTLKDSDPANIEDLVHKIINNKFIDGQLDECDLTLKDLEIIATVFNRILGGMYHSRVTYPEGNISNNHS